MSPLATYVVQTLVTLLGVCALAVVVLAGARRLGVGRPAGPVTLLGRLGLDGRRAVYLVRVGAKVYVVGASEAGLSSLGELPAAELGDAPEASPAHGFAAVLARVGGGSSPPAAPREAAEAPREAAEEPDRD